MTDIERKERIDSIQRELEPINQERIFLETKLDFAKERYTNSFKDEDKNEINKLSATISLLYTRTHPLFSELRTLQCKYVIEYKGELTNPETQINYWKTANEIFYMKNCCDINTWSNGWGLYLKDDCVHNLITEVHELIYKLRYTKFRILNIKRL